MAGSRDSLLLVIAGGVAALAIACLATAAREDGAAEFLVARETVADLGHLAAGGRAKAAFTLENHSSQRIEIVQTSSSCGCLVAAPDKGGLSPGESCVVSAELVVPNVKAEVVRPVTFFYRVGFDMQVRALGLTVKAQVTALASSTE